jgi:hypothetical protein
MEIAQLISPLISAAFGGIAAYVAIRSDLAALKARMDNAEKSTDQAHSRIDQMLHK